MLFSVATLMALFLDELILGISAAASIPMMAITINISMSVNQESLRIYIRKIKYMLVFDATDGNFCY
jgi:hypothetical protein